ncbi:hypothetical protein Ahu01nite_058160 [Winogradskya humida]|uniref:Uncharacterized protein n=1 Tax=Winogradskya humida TaxID=113566 RepID=A0ABQ3ZVU9_9ACTN|nr:hypothetical protein Ahu01nite_058160 [Actinoplanes humidus]
MRRDMWETRGGPGDRFSGWGGIRGAVRFGRFVGLEWESAGDARSLVAGYRKGRVGGCDVIDLGCV